MPITSYTGGGLGERSPSGGSSMVPLCSLRLTSFNCMQPSEGSDRQQQGTGRQDITPEAWAPSAGYLAVQVQHLLVAAATDGRRYDDLQSSGLDCSLRSFYFEGETAPLLHTMNLRPACHSPAYRC